LITRAAAAKRNPNSISSMEEFWWFIGIVYALLVLPVLGYFVYSMLKDPASREILPLLRDWTKQRICGFLAPQRDPSIHHQPPHPLRDAKHKRL
jgi:hypothetical protein